MIVGSSGYLNSVRARGVKPIMVGNSMVPFSESVKYLGMTISCTLDWNEHVSGCMKRVNMTLHRLKVCKRLLPTSVREVLVISLINPLIDYGCLVYNSLSKEQNLKLQRAYNSCVRMIFNVNRMDQITPYFTKLRWLKIDRRREYFLGMFVYRLLGTGRPKYLLQKLTYRTHLAVRTTRVSSSILSLPQCRTETFKRSFLYIYGIYGSGVLE
ncbi:craniofacial development protein 2-like protein [Lasius niger]|uniref:Craniofacial development protein 2-like protein n=1 Tax=Lasius niger TaxID=67767 RepID=A0A0J7KK58_LASNI|nr:craniofacial development protein 2-like protein [Lasius niger]